MKAYEFYVLLGKYKRKSLTRAEFDRFCRAIETIRNFRHSFYESTGEYYPVARRKKSSASSARRSMSAKKIKSRATVPQAVGQGVTVSPANEFVEHAWSSGSRRSKRAESVAHGEDPISGILDQHQNFRRVRSMKKRKKFRWYRLGRDILRHHPFKLFLVIIFVIGVTIVSIIRPGFSGPSLKPATDARLEDLSSEATKADVTIDSLTSGRYLSEADRLLAVDPSAFELNIETELQTPPKVPIVGLEQAIKEGLESRFSDPATALPKLNLPKIETNEARPATD